MKPSLFITLLASAFILLMLELILGSVNIPLKAVIGILLGEDAQDMPVSWYVIVWESRLPRALAAIAAGILLSVSGLFMQTLFRNPLAGPHILGVSAASSLGVAVVIVLFSGFGVSLGMAGELGLDLLIVLASFLGAMGVLMALFLISMKVKDVLTVLVFGVLIGSVCLAIVGILQYISPESQLKAFLIWTLGSFDGVDMQEAGMLMLVALPVLASTIFLVKPLNLLLLGEEYASSMGLNVVRSRLFIMISAGVMTALITAYCGPIGFIGVVVPHFSRMILKSSDHGPLIMFSMLIGANVMLLSDLISHLPGSHLILPVNSITSLIGIPFIFWMLLKRKMVSSV